MVNREESMQIARTIMHQMGGHLKAMVNARDILALNGESYPTGGLQFAFSGKRGMNKCLVILEADDTYTVQFWYCKFNRKTFEAISEMKKEFTGVYCDMLVDIFESTTGLYLSLGTMGR